MRGEFDLVNAVVSLPLLDVKVRILRSFGQALVVTGLGSHLSAHKGSELGLAELLGNNIGADLAPLNDITTVLCVSTHGSSSVSLVEATANILGCELKMAVFAHAEDLCGPHGRRIGLSENEK